MTEETGRTILLVEDQSALRELLGSLLRDGGYRVLEVGSPSEALEAAARERVDLLVTDITLPELDGPELAARLIAQQPQLRTLFITGYLEEELEEDLAGPVLHKPFQPSELEDAVRRLLDEPATS